jgi:hypothetical protein
LLSLLVSMKKGPVSSADVWLVRLLRLVVWSSAHVSMASWGRIRRNWNVRSGRMSKGGGQAARRKAAPLGANGSFRVSMCQIAWASRRAMSTWAILAPRCLPSLRLLRW